MHIIDELRLALARPMVELVARDGPQGHGLAGKRPGTAVQCWFGKVTHYLPREGLPLDAGQRPMVPLAQLYLPALPLVPQALAGIELLTVFMSQTMPGRSERMGRGWVVREYPSLDGLVVKDLRVEPPVIGTSLLQALGLTVGSVRQDWPCGDDAGLPAEVLGVLLELEEDRGLDFEDIVGSHTLAHKVGGWPSFCQGGRSFGPGYEFVFQISSDSAAGLNIVDGGSFMFARNPRTRTWVMYYDYL